VFVHGCFWHVHDGCKFATKPSSRKEFWKEKFEANRKRDRRNYAALATQGWRVFVVWECAIKGRKEDELDKLGEAVERWLKSDDGYGEIEGNHDAPVKKESAKRNVGR